MPARTGCGGFAKDGTHYDTVFDHLHVVPQYAGLHHSIGPNGNIVSQYGAFHRGRGMNVAALPFDHEAGGDLVSVQRGYDPRDFTLIAYGGSGPMFAPFIMRELEIESFVVPAVPPGVFSAWGMLNTDIKHSKVFTDITRLDREKAEDRINENFCSLENEVFDLFIDHLKKPRLERFADVRYYGQEHTVRIPINLDNIDSNRLKEIIQLFHIHHEREYEFKLPNDPIEIVNYQVVGTIPVTHLEQEEYKNPEIIEEEKVRKVYLGGRYIEVPIFNRYNIQTDAQIQGPTIIEGPTSTIIVLDKQTASLDTYGNIIVRRLS